MRGAGRIGEKEWERKGKGEEEWGGGGGLGRRDEGEWGGWRKIRESGR